MRSQAQGQEWERRGPVFSTSHWPQTKSHYFGVAMSTFPTGPLFDEQSPSVSETATPSDALVFFGATGDLAYKKIFPALQTMVVRRNLDIPIIGVAFSNWTAEQLLNRARESVTKHCPEVKDGDFAKLAKLLHYVDGDYKKPETFDKLKAELGGA